MVFARSVTISARGRPQIAFVAVTSLGDGYSRLGRTRAVAGHALCVVRLSAFGRRRLSRTGRGNPVDYGGGKRKSAAECQHAHAYDSSLHLTISVHLRLMRLRRCRRPIATDVPPSLPTGIVSAQWYCARRNRLWFPEAKGMWILPQGWENSRDPKCKDLDVPAAALAHC